MENSIISYQKCFEDEKFYATLKNRINKYFKVNELQKTANLTAWIKVVSLFSIYAYCHYLLFTSQAMMQLFVSYGMLGVCTISIALNIAHDAAHQTFSKSKFTNGILVYMFDLLGASGYLWKLKHIHSHHKHVNIPGLDSDIKQSNLVRIFPESLFLSFHKYQHLYMPFLYAVYTLYWLMIRDFKDFISSDLKEIAGPKKKIAFMLLVLSKVFFISRFLIIPYLLLDFSIWIIFTGFILFHVIASLTVTIALISSHVGETSVFPKPNGEGEMNHSWVKHQLETTSDFATANPIVTHLFGGFNHHVIHHLCPNICHIHYPKLTPILVETCKEFGLKYRSEPSFLAAAKSHFKFLRLRSIMDEF